MSVLVAGLALCVSVFGTVATIAAPDAAYARTGFHATSGAAEAVTAIFLQADLVLVLVVGLLLCLRMPGHPIGWLLLALGFVFSMGAATLGWMLQAFSPGMTLAGGSFSAWAYGLLDGPALGLLGAILLLFPTGRVESRLWLQAYLIALAIDAAAITLLAVVPGPLAMAPAIQNPVGLAGIGRPDDGLLAAGFVIGVAGPPLVGAGSMIGRFRHASAVERLQLRWVAAAGALIPIVFFALVARATLLSSGWDTASGAIEFASFAAIPLGIGIAILRYRLYAIDLILNRTAVYATLSVVLVALFVTGNVALQYIVESLTKQRSELLSGALGVGVGLLFVPMRRWIRPLADRVLPGRAMLALLFTDIVGSTETIVDIGDQRWRALLGRYLGAVRTELARHNGHEVNTAGDAFFATFNHPLDALHAAHAIRASVKDLGLETRTGLHVGEVEMRGEQVSGLAVHTAARIMAAADAGEIFISNAMRYALSAADVSVRDRGRHTLKGVPGDWRLYAVEPAGRVMGT